MRLEYFTGPEGLEGVRGIREAAKEILEGRSPQHPEMQMALRKLLAARDCLVRAAGPAYCENCKSLIG